jgi:hypothetical protein
MALNYCCFHTRSQSQKEMYHIFWSFTKSQNPLSKDSSRPESQNVKPSPRHILIINHWYKTFRKEKWSNSADMTESKWLNAGWIWFTNTILPTDSIKCPSPFQNSYRSCLSSSFSIMPTNNQQVLSIAQLL